MERNLGVGSWIARRAAMTPNRLAIAFGDRRITYGALDERVTRLARALAARGVGEGDRVAFFGHNHPAALESLFACGLLGAVHVPLHPGFDDGERAHVLAAAEPKAWIVTPELLPAADRVARAVQPPLRFTTGLVGEAAGRYEELVAEGSDEPLDRAIGLDHTAVLAWSSGTTGPSKGVCLSHGNLLFNALNTASCIDVARDDLLLGSAPLYRMGGLGFALALLFQGGAVVLQERADPERSLALVAEARATVLFDSVGALSAMTRSSAFPRADLASVRVAAVGGSPVPPSLVQAFRARGVCLQPGYGLTEAAPLALMVGRDEVVTHPGAAGRAPLFGAARVVGADLEELAPGEVGELLVRGPNVMQGYFRDPEATARALVDGWLRTGDAARASADGMISVLGRLSDSLVLGGARVHPGPLEETLRERGEVADCALVQAEPEGVPTLVVVPPERTRLEPLRVRALARAFLPTSTRLTLSVRRALPTNPNGKILRAVLRRGAAVDPIARAR